MPLLSVRPTTRARAPGPLLAALLASALCAGCVAPIIWGNVVREPTLYTYTGAHGLPRAYGGGVCALGERHGHRFGPVPKSAYAVDENGELTETRTLYAYFNPHPHHGGTCFREAWHLHTEPPLPTLTWDAGLAAFVARDDGEPLTVFASGHEDLPCHPGPCTEDDAHAHRTCAPSPVRDATVTTARP